MIYEIDDQLDYGLIIVQWECVIELWDFLGSVYVWLMDIECELVLEYFDVIWDGSYMVKLLVIEGNFNLKKDFE